MKIYIAYSSIDYNTDYEKAIIEKVRYLYPDIKDQDILNPKTVKIEEEDKKKSLIFQEWKYYCPLIDKASIIIAAVCLNDIRYKGKYTGGAKWEIGYGKRTKKVVLELGENLEVTNCL